MGYCPYMCIVCERIEDNGWWEPGIDEDNYYRCEVTKRKLYINFDNELERYEHANYNENCKHDYNCRYVLDEDDECAGYLLSYDVCNNCYPKIEDNSYSEEEQDSDG